MKCIGRCKRMYKENVKTSTFLSFVSNFKQFLSFIF